MLDCDWCEVLFPTSELFNVEYKNGNGNVLCEKCVNASIEIFQDDFDFAWR